MFFTIVLVNFSFGNFYVAYNEILSPRTEQKTFSKRVALSLCLLKSYLQPEETVISA